jgi:transcriptional regulator with XRE-family HTH domain
MTEQQHAYNMGCIGTNFKHFRELSNLTQEDVAKALGINRNYISLVEKGSKYPTIKILFEAAELFKVSPDRLLNLSGYLLETLRQLVEAFGFEEVFSELKKCQ